MNSKEGRKVKHWVLRGSNTIVCKAAGSHLYRTWYRPDVTCKRCKKIMRARK